MVGRAKPSDPGRLDDLAEVHPAFLEMLISKIDVSLQDMVEGPKCRIKSLCQAGVAAPANFGEANSQRH